MNRLNPLKKIQIINLLIEGVSLRATSRISDVSINTVIKLLVEVGIACENFHNEKVRGVNTIRIQAFKIWSGVYSKAKNVSVEKKDKAGDIWTLTAIDQDSKLIVSWFVGDLANGANLLLNDVSERILNEAQISIDCDLFNKEAIEKFRVNPDYGRIVKAQGSDQSGENRYVTRMTEQGNTEHKYISTSLVKSRNLPMQIQMRPFMGFTDGFSNKIDNQVCAIALHFVSYNFVKVHETLRVTPAMKAGLVKKPMTIEEMVELTKG